MKLAFLYLDQPHDFNTSSGYLKIYEDRHALFIQLMQKTDSSISIIQRASYQETFTQDKITYYFTRDGYSATLRWWQEPVALFEIAAKLKPDLVQIDKLNLPLNFRWLRRIVGENVKIIGNHGGEDIWAQRNLWLQQFGLRVVDGFIFQKKADTEPWIRAAVILPRQPIFIMGSYGIAKQSEVEKLGHIYREVLQ